MSSPLAQATAQESRANAQQTLREMAPISHRPPAVFRRFPCRFHFVKSDFREPYTVPVAGASRQKPQGLPENESTAEALEIGCDCGISTRWISLYIGPLSIRVPHFSLRRSCFSGGAGGGDRSASNDSSLWNRLFFRLCLNELFAVGQSSFSLPSCTVCRSSNGASWRRSKCST